MGGFLGRSVGIISKRKDRIALGWGTLLRGKGRRSLGNKLFFLVEKEAARRTRGKCPRAALTRKVLPACYKVTFLE